MSIIIDSLEDSSTLTGGIPVADLLTRLSNLMSDEDKVRWTESERIDWFNDAATEIVQRRPAARSITMQIALIAGTYQDIPDGAAQLLDVIRNVTATGTADTAIRICDRQALDDAEPDWHTRRAGKTRHFTIDERSPTSFYVYPPAVAGAKVDILVSKPPPVVTEAEDTLYLRPEFINAILNWAMYRCHTKDSEYSQGAVAGQHYQAFTDAIGAPAMAAGQNSATGNDA